MVIVVFKRQDVDSRPLALQCDRQCPQSAVENVLEIHLPMGSCKFSFPSLINLAAMMAVIGFETEATQELVVD